MTVRYIHYDKIEKIAKNILAEYSRNCEPIKTPPVPVVGILEALGLSLELDDLRDRLQMDDVFGAIWLDSREVFIDQSIDPSLNERMEGRYNFTLGHEIGHWVLHHKYPRYLDMKSSRQKQHNTQLRSAPDIVCRKGGARDPMEWQADKFSAFLLMPRAVVCDTWRDRFGDIVPPFGNTEEWSWARNLDENITEEGIRVLALDMILSLL